MVKRFSTRWETKKLYLLKTIKMIKSPLGRVCIPVKTKKEWKQLTKALEKHPISFLWTGGIDPTEVDAWSDEKGVSHINLGFGSKDVREMSYAAHRICDIGQHVIMPLAEALSKLDEKFQEVAKSPLGSVGVRARTEEQFNDLMKALEAHKCEFYWRSGELPTESGDWDEVEEDTIVTFGSCGDWDDRMGVQGSSLGLLGVLAGASCDKKISTKKALEKLKTK